MARVQTSMEGAEVQPLGGEVCWSTVTGHSGSSPRWRRQAVANGQVHTCAEQVGGTSVEERPGAPSVCTGRAAGDNLGWRGPASRADWGASAGRGPGAPRLWPSVPTRAARAPKDHVCVLDSRLGRSPAEPSHPRRRQTGQPPEPAQKTPAPCSVLVSSVRKLNIRPTAKEKRWTLTCPSLQRRYWKMNLELTGNKLTTDSRPKRKRRWAITAILIVLKSVKLPVETEQQGWSKE